MGFKDFAKNQLKKAISAGKVSGHSFSRGTYINFVTKEDELCMVFTSSDGSHEEVITHDMIKCATVLSMGVIDIENKTNGTTLIYGTKYLVVFKDGRQAVLTVGLGDTLYSVERVLF